MREMTRMGEWRWKSVRTAVACGLRLDSPSFGKRLAMSGAISPFLSGLSLSLSVLRRLVPLLLARLRLRQTCYVITVGAHSGKFSVSWRVAATLSSRQHCARVDRRTVRPACDIRPVKSSWTGCWICLNYIAWRRSSNITSIHVTW